MFSGYSSIFLWWSAESFMPASILLALLTTAEFSFFWVTKHIMCRGWQLGLSGTFLGLTTLRPSESKSSFWILAQWASPKAIKHVFSCNGWTIQYAMVDHKGLFVVSHDRKSGIASRIQRASIFPLHHSQVIGLSFWPGSPDGVKMLTTARQSPALCHFLGTKQTFSEASYRIFLNILLARIMSPAHAAASHIAQEMKPCWILWPVEDLYPV